MGKTRLQMRTDLATDLKITIETEVTAAELNRCIERAVSDLSRFLPQELTYEEILDFTVTGEEVTMPKDTDVDGVVADEDLTAITAGSNTSIAGQPDVPRPLTITITDANDTLTGLTITAYGTDEDELAVEETFHWLRGDSKTIPGKEYFKNVYMVYVDQLAGAGAGDVLDVGWGVYTGVWVYLANKPIKWGSEASATDSDDNTIVRDTDFWIDYVNGRIKAVVDGDIVAEDTVTISYVKNQTHIDLSDVADMIRVHRVEYPVGNIPQSFVDNEVFAKMVSIVESGDSYDQQALMDKKQVRVYYDASHTAPNDYAPGTVPQFLENTVLQAAASYVLFILALKYEHAAATDLASARTEFGLTTDIHALMVTALASMAKYLDNNTNVDAVGILARITTDADALRTAITAALGNASTALGLTTTDLASADTVRASYIAATDYVDGATEPGIKAYLDAGDALINSTTEGGEDEKTPETYALFARVAKEALVGAFENDRKLFQQNATTRTNSALGYVQEAAQRLANVRSYLEQSNGYSSVAAAFAREAELRLAEINSIIVEGGKYIEAAGGNLVLSDRFKANATERRDEVWAVWRDRKQYIGDFASSSLKQNR